MTSVKPRCGTLLHSDDSYLVVIDPAWTDHQIRDVVTDAIYINQGDPFEYSVHTLYAYSAAQLRALGMDPDQQSYWGDDGELATSIIVAEVHRP